MVTSTSEQIGLSATKACTSCGEDKPYSEYSLNTGKGWRAPDGTQRRSACKECSNKAGRARRRQQITPKLPEGYVYVISHPYRFSYVKIGRTADPERRLGAANTWCPEQDFYLVGYRLFNDCLVAEAEVHRRLSPVHRGGEWFEISEEDAISLVHSIRETNNNEKGAE